MAKKLGLHASDLVGFSRLANGAVAGVTGVVEAVHGEIASTSGVGTGPAQRLTAGISSLVYRSIRGVTGLIDSSLIASEPWVPAGNDRPVSLRREAIVAAINGVLGDYLVRTNNPLAISMSLRRHGRSLQIERSALRAAIARPTGKVLLLVHGLCLNDLQWKRKGHDHGAALARELGYTPVYLHYNSGLHVSQSGRLLSDLLERLVEQWPVAVEELAIVAHSMGGLVSRSAHSLAVKPHATKPGTEAGQRWPGYLRKLIFLGTPHHGAPLERLGSWVDTALEGSPYTVPFARLGKIRSAGITDMRYGNLQEDDWKDRDRFAPEGDVRTPLPLPQDVQCYAIAAARQEVLEDSELELAGDGLVTVDSALGRHVRSGMSLGFEDSHVWIGRGMNNWDLLSDIEVFEKIRGWLGSEA